MADFKFNVDYVRQQFPCLSRTVNGFPAAFLDGPGGYQVPKRVVDKIEDYLFYRNANSHGSFVTSAESDALVWESRQAFADFLNCEPEEVIFGANSSSNNFRLAMGLVRNMEPGSEIMVTDQDHEGNRSPWRTLEDFGMVIKNVSVDPETDTLNMADFKEKLSSKTKLVAINWAANATGIITDVKECIRLAHEVGALTMVDAVHYAAHKLIDVQEIDTDFLVCSAYKFFGPHIGIMYVKKEVGEKINSLRVMADDNLDMPYKFEVGTPPMELIAGAAEAVDFIADIGKTHESFFLEELQGETARRRLIVAGMLAIDAYETPLAKKLKDGLKAIEGVTLYGCLEGYPKTSTVAFTIEGINSNEVGKYLGEKGLFVWDGDFYAIQTINCVHKLKEQGGMVRVGLAPYNLDSEVDRVIDCVKAFVRTKKG